MSGWHGEEIRTAHPCTFIQVFSRYLQRGGEEASVARIASHLERAGHRVTRFWRASEEWSGPHAPPKWLQPFLLWNNAPVLQQLRDLHLSVKPQAWILHNVIPVVSLGVYGLARELGVPVLQWLHNYRPISPGATLSTGRQRLRPDDPLLVCKEILAGTWHGPLLTAWQALGYARVKSRGDFESVRAWIAVSDDVKCAFALAGWPTSRLFTLRHSWDTAELAPATNDRGYFLFLGRMVETKGVRFLVDVWRDPALRAVELVMAGEGPLRDELSQTTPPNVRWVGFVQGEEKSRLVAGCRAVLFPCLWSEPLSTVAYEAYERGRSILSSALGGMKELVIDGETGRLLPPGNAAAWREAILEFSRDAELTCRLGAKGRRWLEENVSPAAWNRQLDRILAAALGFGAPK
jgi:glycosyltransferase involved in cell wall biosynthesis